MSLEYQPNIVRDLITLDPYISEKDRDTSLLKYAYIFFCGFAFLAYIASDTSII